MVLGAVILFVLLFFGLRQYEVSTEDGVRLEIPFLMDDQPMEDGERSSLVGFILGVVLCLVLRERPSKNQGGSKHEEQIKKNALTISVQLILYFIILVVFAWIVRGDMLWAAIGVAVTLLVLALIRLNKAGKRR